MELKTGTCIEVTFQDGLVKQFDMETLFEKYPQLEELKNRDIFEQGKLEGPYGIVWNDTLDIEAETIYEEGITVRIEKMPIVMLVGNDVAKARNAKNMTQKELSVVTGIDQSDISRIERGVANPSLSTLERIAEAMNLRLNITLERNQENN